MPIYEYKCADCERLTSVFTRNVNAPVSEKCKHCGSKKLERVMSKFAHHRTEADVL